MEYILAIVVLLCAIPLGYLLKYETKEEINAGRGYFKILWAGSLALAIFSLFLPINLIIKQTLIFSLIFMAIVSFVSWK